ncbi:MAG: tetratricopeptide repeat protein, partial [Phycisphaerae bacterium]
MEGKGDLFMVKCTSAPHKTKIKIAVVTAVIIYMLIPSQALGRALPKPSKPQPVPVKNSSRKSVTLRTMARIHLAVADYDQAQVLAEQALSVAQKTNADDAELAYCLIDLAYLYNCRGNLEQAEKMCGLGLKLQQKIYYPKHPYLAYTLRILSDIYRGQGKYQQANETLDSA